MLFEEHLKVVLSEGYLKIITVEGHLKVISFGAMAIKRTI
jgi:hypothetical protein